MKATKSQIKAIGRLKRRSDFLAVQAQQKKWVAKTMVIQAGSNMLDQVRFGITITKRTASSAVLRNRIRRRLRSVALDVLPDLGLPSGTDIVLIGRIEAAEASYEALSRDLSWCLCRLGLSTSAEEPQR